MHFQWSLLQTEWSQCSTFSHLGCCKVLFDVPPSVAYSVLMQRGSWSVLCLTSKASEILCGPWVCSTHMSESTLALKSPATSMVLQVVSLTCCRILKKFWDKGWNIRILEIIAFKWPAVCLCMSPYLSLAHISFGVLAFHCFPSALPVPTASPVSFILQPSISYFLCLCWSLSQTIFSSEMQLRILIPYLPNSLGTRWILLYAFFSSISRPVWLFL